MNRRQFLTVGMGGILLAAVAPAIVRADSLMRIIPVDTVVIAPKIAPDGMWYYTAYKDRSNYHLGFAGTEMIEKLQAAAPSYEWRIAKTPLPHPARQQAEGRAE